jgi:multiple antibiotic resistance protein
MNKRALVELFFCLPDTFIPLFVAIDVFYIAPVYMVMTRQFDQKEKDAVALKSVVVSFVICVLFIGLGNFIFRTMGITVNDFKIAGGLLLLVFAVLEMTKSNEIKAAEGADVGIAPLAVPLIVGPAVLTTLFILVENFGVAATLAGLLLNLALVWLVFKGSRLIVSVVGTNTILVASKLLAVLLAAFAVMFIRIGVLNVLKNAVSDYAPEETGDTIINMIKYYVL